MQEPDYNHSAEINNGSENPVCCARERGKNATLRKIKVS